MDEIGCWYMPGLDWGYVPGPIGAHLAWIGGVCQARFLRLCGLRLIKFGWPDHGLASVAK